MRSLAARVALMVLVGTSLVLGLVLGFNYFSSTRIFLREAKEDAGNLSRSAASRMELELHSVEEITRTVALAVELSALNREKLLRFVERVVKKQDQIFGTTVAFEPFAFEPNVRGFAPYFHETPQGVSFKQLGTDSYNYLAQDWYQKCKEAQEGVWSEPYFDKGGGNIVMTTFSFPFFWRNSDGTRGKFRGVVTADLSVGWLTDYLATWGVNRMAFAFLLSRRGTFLSHPDRALILKESIFSLAEKHRDPKLKKIGQEMLTRADGFLDVGTAMGSGDSFLAFYRLPANGWALGLVFPKTELFREVNELHRRSLLIAICGILLLVGVGILVGISVARPLRAMATAARKVAQGDLEVDLSDIKRNDEVGQLSQAFTRMASDLKLYLRDLTETTAAKERMQGELAVAAQIQHSMVPSVFPAFPERCDFDIHAMMKPAKEVGGDFYHFFLVDEHHLCFAIGDVADKGVPAALIMSVTSALLKALANEGATPDQILTRINAEVLSGNESCMFVTMFYGFLHLRTGELFYANGGHDPPFIISPDMTVSTLSAPGGPIVGAFDEASYRTDRIMLRPGTTIFAYTDGVTEALNPDRQLFSEERLRKTLSETKPAGTKELVDRVEKAVESFSQGSQQADDITMIAVTFSGPGPS